jgi:hypothetical protein
LEFTLETLITPGAALFEVYFVRTDEQLGTTVPYYGIEHTSSSIIPVFYPSLIGGHFGFESLLGLTLLLLVLLSVRPKTF